MRWYLASLAAALFPCWLWGRSKSGSVVMAVSITPPVDADDSIDRQQWLSLDLDHK
jgi:hypothetical protein